VKDFVHRRAGCVRNAFQEGLNGFPT